MVKYNYEVMGHKSKYYMRKYRGEVCIKERFQLTDSLVIGIKSFNFSSIGSINIGRYPFRIGAGRRKPAFLTITYEILMKWISVALKDRRICCRYIRINNIMNNSDSHNEVEDSGKLKWSHSPVLKSVDL